MNAEKTDNSKTVDETPTSEKSEQIETSDMTILKIQPLII